MSETLEYIWPGGQVSTFTAEEFVLKNDSETFLIGFDTYGEELTVLGLVEDEHGKLYCYHVKQHSQEFYRDIISKHNGKTVFLKSDISSGIWVGEEFRVAKMSNKVKYLISELEGPVTLINKGPDNEYFVPNPGTGFPTLHTKKPLRNVDDRPYSDKAILKLRLAKAVEKEDYRLAAKLKNKLDGLL